MSGVIRKYHLSSGAALNRRQLRELYLEAASRFNRLMNHSLADDTFLRTDFYAYVWEDFYWSTADELNFVTPPAGTMVPGSQLEVNLPDQATQMRVQWNAWVQATAISSQSVCIWPVVGGEAVWDAACIRQAGSIATYDPVPATADPFGDKQSSNLFAAGDRFTMGGEGYLDLPSAGKLHYGLLCFSIGEFRIRFASMMGSRLAR